MPALPAKRSPSPAASTRAKPLPMSDSLHPSLRQWVADQADKLGLPSPDSYIELVLRLEKQRQALVGVDERYRRVFRPQ
jgi:hypothetical protein